MTGASTKRRVAIVGGGMTALETLATLMADPHTDLVGLVPTRPEDLIYHLEQYGYRLTDPCPVPLLFDLGELAGQPPPDWIVDTRDDPKAAQSLAKAGLAHIPRLNPAALAAMDHWQIPSEKPAHLRAGYETGESFGERLAREVGRAYRHDRCVGLVLLRQPSWNTTTPPHSVHLIGALEHSLRLADTVSPLDDDTLAVMLPEAGEAVRLVANRLTSNLATLRIRYEGEQTPCQEVGWAWFPQDGKTAPALLETARIRMASPAAPDRIPGIRH